MAGIENIFNSPEKQKKVKELTRKTNEGLLAVKELFELYGMDGFDELQKSVVVAYKAERLQIENETNDDADITYLPPTRQRKVKTEGAEEVPTAETPTAETPTAKTTTSVADKVKANAKHKKGENKTDDM